MRLLCLRVGGGPRRKWTPPSGGQVLQGGRPRPPTSNSSVSTRPSGEDNRGHRRNTRMTLSVVVTEDTPADMLTGQMSITVLLPSGKPVTMNVNRSTPMIDLLVQVTTANKLSPAGHLLQLFGDGGQLPYKPSTPIGALDTWTVQVVPKLGSSQNSSSTKSGSRGSAQPFEQTFRLQVHLPRNQLYVMRVSAKTVLGEILKQVCQEKCLDPNKYSLRHPRQLGQVLDKRLTIAQYRHNQICIVSNRSAQTTLSTDDILAMHHQYPSSIRSGGSSSRSLSPDSSVSPQPASAPNILLQHHQQNGTVEGPQRNNRKRRPAPKPPVQQQNVGHQQQDNDKTKQSSGVSYSDGGGRTVICHSRTSSDSSGYHEASVLSESPDSNNSLADSLPRRSKLPTDKEPNNQGRRGAPREPKITEPKRQAVVGAPLQNQQPLSRSLINISATTASNNKQRLSSVKQQPPPPPGRKKKPAPAPPVVSRLTGAPSSLVSSSSKTLPPGVKLLECPPPLHPEVVGQESSPASSGSSALVATGTPYSIKDEEPTMADEEIDRIFKDATRDNESASLDSDSDAADKEAIMTQPSLPCTPPLPSGDVEGHLDTEATDVVDRIPEKQSTREEIVVEVQIEKSPVQSQSPPAQKVATPSVAVMEQKRNSGIQEELPRVLEDVPKVQEVPRALEIKRQTSQGSDKSAEREKHAVEVLNELSNRINERKNKQQNEETSLLTAGRRGSQQDTVISTGCLLDNFKITTYDSSTTRVKTTTQAVKTQEDVVPEGNSDSIEGQHVSQRKQPNIMQVKRVMSVEAPERAKPASFTTTTSEEGNNDDDNYNAQRKWINGGPPSVKRSVSLAFHVGRGQPPQHQPRLHQELSLQPSDSLRGVCEDLPEFTSLEERRRMLRKATSELSIVEPAINENRKKRKQFENSITGLQSLKVIKSILPQLSQSHGSVDQLGTAPHSSTNIVDSEPESCVSVKSKVAAFNRSSTEIDRVASESSTIEKSGSTTRSENVWEKPKVTMTTWVEREKREVSIKWDQDYYVEQQSQQQQQQQQQVHEHQTHKQPEANDARTREADSRRVVIVEEKMKETVGTEEWRPQHQQTKPQYPQLQTKQQIKPQYQPPHVKQSQMRVTNGHSIYRSIETGNTRPIGRQHLQQHQQQYHLQQQEQHHLRQRCGTLEVNPPPPPPPTVVKVIAAVPRPVPSISNSLVSRIQIRCEGLSRASGKPTVRSVPGATQDTRGQLLNQIRAFGGRANLRKIST